MGVLGHKGSSHGNNSPFFVSHMIADMSTLAKVGWVVMDYHSVCPNRRRGRRDAALSKRCCESVSPLLTQTRRSLLYSKTSFPPLFETSYCIVCVHVWYM